MLRNSISNQIELNASSSNSNRSDKCVRFEMALRIHVELIN